jgi:hypothetical protein
MKRAVNNLFFIIAFTGILLSCKEKRIYFGSVVTQHGIAVPNAKVSLHMIPATAINGRTTDGEFHNTSTNSSGAFSIQMRAGHKYYVDGFSVTSDSGKYQSRNIPEGRENKIVVQ